MKVSKDVQKLLEDRYLLRTEKTWDDLAERVGGIYPPATDLIKQMKFIPSTPTLMNGNTNGARKGGLSSCFPMGIEDSIDGIFDALKDAAIVTKNSGGVGFNFSKLRSSKEEVSSLDGRKSTGPLPFLDMFNSMLDGIRQGGARRGAGMCMLDINHPDIIDFIEAKSDTDGKRFNRFNISVRIPDSFYKSLEETPDAQMIVVNVTDKKENGLLDRDGKPISYKQLWTKIVKHAHQSAEPGLFNSDIAFRQCSVTNYSQDVLSNPCLEFTNIANSSCNLGSLNLTKYVTNNSFDFKSFGIDVDIATRFLDRVIDVNQFQTKAIEETTKAIRSIGLGVMGLAHALILLDIPYNSLEAKKLTKKIIGYMTLKSMETSVEIGKETQTYSAFDYLTFIEANKRFFVDNDILENNQYGESVLEDLNVSNIILNVFNHGVRNSCFTSCAPTGSISYISDVSGGIEPIFALAYIRKIEKGTDHTGKIIYENVYLADRFFEDYLNKNYPETKTEILKYTSENKGSCQGCKHFRKKDQDLFKTAQDLKSTEHLDILESTSSMISLAVSKTINLPELATVEDVSKVYIDAHKRGIIGVTVYRDNSRGGVLVHSVEEDKKIKVNHAPKRPKELDGDVHLIVVNKQLYYVVIGKLDGEVYEIFSGINFSEDGELHIPKTVKTGKIVKNGRGDYDFVCKETKVVYHLTGSHNNTEADALSRSLSTSLRHGVPIDVVVTQLEKTKGSLNSFSKAISRTLKHYIKNGTIVLGNECSCGGKLIRESGCLTCKSCGASKCG